MINPYIGQTTIDTEEKIMDRAEQIAELRLYMQKRSDGALFGPEGSGKSTLLRCVFNIDYRKEMARNHTLIYMGEFPKGKSSEDVYGFFADSIRNAVSILRMCGMRDTMNEILECLNDISYDSKQSRFDQYLDTIIMYGYRMVFVLDNFENFTSSADVKAEHHNLLCGMLNDHKLQMIVATNFDFNATSLPRGMTNSTLLSRLSPNTVHMTPLSRESCETLLRKTAMDCGCGFCFSEEQSRFIYELSGGIPLLLNLTARYVFEAISNGAEENWKEIARRNALQDAGPILKRWCKIMTSEQLQLLEDLPKKGDGLSEDEVILATALQKRGILEKGSQCNSGEIWKSTDAYCYNSGLLDEFCRDPEWMNEAARCNPLKKEESDLLSFDPSALIGGNQGTVHIEKIEIHNGDRYETTYQPTVMTGGFDKLFEILALNPSQMGGRLRDMFTTSLPTIVDADQTAEHISTLFIPEAVESGTLEEFQEEQKTLEIKFQAVRSKVLPNLDDDLMDLLSVKCRLYLQIAVVVEDALSVLDNFKLGDLSAQMVMYGKVLEQQLRDNLYPLFHKEDGLKHFDTFVKQNNPYSDKTFASMSVKKTCIGNYVYLMQDCSSHLKDLCSSNEVYYNTGVITSQWWSQLGSDVNDARDLRNRTDHAGSETNKANLESMHDLLFGNGQIMRRCVVGSDLTRKLWPEAETASAGSSSCIPVVEENVDSWIGKIVTVTNIEATKRGSLRGSFEGSHYAVSISPKKLLECGCRAEDFLGQCINARIIRWDKNAQAFNGELV